jgi:hypothetical protein
MNGMSQIWALWAIFGHLYNLKVLAILNQTQH